MYQVTIVYRDEREDKVIMEVAYDKACSLVNDYAHLPEVKSSAVKEIK